MDYNNLRVVDLKALAKERGLRGYSRLKKAELIAFLRDNLQSRTRPPPIPTPAMHTRPPPPPPPPPLQAVAVQAQVQSVMFRPDRPRQPELLRQLNSQPVRTAPEFKPYQLKPKRSTNVEPFLELPMMKPLEERPTDLKEA